VTKQERAASRQALVRLVKQGELERGSRDGEFRVVEGDMHEMDYKAPQDLSHTNLQWPLDIHQHATVYPGNIVIIAGSSNVGKTGMMLDIIHRNMNKHEIHYFNSEMGTIELQKRLLAFTDVRIDDWKFNAYERSGNFADVIRPGRGIVNIIDYLEVTEDFFRVGGLIRAVHEKLDGAIAIINMQKKDGAGDLARGAEFTLEKARLYISMYRDGLENVCRLVKVKNWGENVEHNPNGLQCRFKLAAGHKFIITEEWHR
jgi:hypothetical protein